MPKRKPPAIRVYYDAATFLVDGWRLFYHIHNERWVFHKEGLLRRLHARLVPKLIEDGFIIEYGSDGKFYIIYDTDLGKVRSFVDNAEIMPPCPWCGSEYIICNQVEDDDGEHFFLSCENCFACGPRVTAIFTKDEMPNRDDEMKNTAKKLWKSRVK